jgi:hypothetical protein
MSHLDDADSVGDPSASTLIVGLWETGGLHVVEFNMNCLYTVEVVAITDAKC